MRDVEPIRPEPVNEGENPYYEIETITSHDFKGRQKEKLRFVYSGEVILIPKEHGNQPGLWSRMR